MFFNDVDPYAAQWLRNLWSDATVDERSVVDLQASDLAGHDRVHLFAGIGGWEYALWLAGWPSDSPVLVGHSTSSTRTTCPGSYHLVADVKAVAR